MAIWELIGSNVPAVFVFVYMVLGLGIIRRLQVIDIAVSRTWRDGKIIGSQGWLAHMRCIHQERRSR